MGYRLQRATGTAMVRYKAIFAEYGLRRTTFSCLSLIIDNPGLQQSQLGETLAIERPNLVYIVEDLTNAGLIRRDKSKTDGRAYALHPTAIGIARFAQAHEAVQRLDREIGDGLTRAELDAFQDIMTKIEKNCSDP